jgi:hypothetical protein
MMERPALRAEAAYLCSLISEHVFQLLEGRLMKIQNSLPQQQLQGTSEEGNAEMQTQGLQEREQVKQQQPQEEEEEKCEKLELEVCQALLGAGLQLYAWTNGIVYTFAALAAEVSLQCVQDQQLAEVLVEATPPVLQSSLQQMLQQASSMCSTGMAVGDGEEGAAGAGGQGVVHPAAQHVSGATAAPPAGLGIAEALAVSRLYLDLCSTFNGHGMQPLLDMPCEVPYLTEGQEMSAPEAFFAEHQAELWQQVMADTEEGIDQPGKLIGCLFRAAASLQAVCKLLLDALLEERSHWSLPQVVDVLHMVENLFTRSPLGSIGGLQPAQTPYCAKSAVAAFHALYSVVPYMSLQYLRWSKLTFCCGYIACGSLQGRSELELVMGGGTGKRGGGYCSSCKRVCYCSEA